MATNYRNLLLCIALTAIVAAIYSPGLSGRFLFDDYPNIVSNNAVHATSLSWDALKRSAAGYEHGAYGRPLATITFALNHIAAGTDPFGYKLVGLGVHLINSVLVLLLVRSLLNLRQPAEPWSRWAPIAIALLWAIHPLQVSSVLYVVQRMETLSLTFVLAALLVYLRGRKAQMQGLPGWPWLLACLPLVLLGMMSKESAAIFPAYAVSLELTLLGFGAHSVRKARMWKWVYVTGAAICMLAFLLVVLPPYLDPAVYEFRGFTLTERLLTQLRVLVLYLGQMLLPLPSHLMFYYDTFAISKGWLQPASTLLCGLLLALVAASAWLLRKRMPVFSLGILWFFSAHLLTSNVFPLELVFEHRNYFALLGVLLALADLARHIPTRDGPALKYATIAAILIGFGFLSLLRSATWGNSLNLAMDLVKSNPLSARASNDLAEQYMMMAGGNPDSPFYSLATTEFERGSRLPNASPLTEQGLILMAGTAGQNANPAWWDRLIEKLRTRPLGPQEHGAIEGLLKHRLKGVELDDNRLAEAYTVLAARSELPTYAYARFGEHAINHLQDEALAQRMFLLAITHEAHDESYAARLVATLAAEGHSKLAKSIEMKALEMGAASHSRSAPAKGNE